MLKETLLRELEKTAISSDSNASKVDVLEAFQRPIHEFNGCEFANEHYKYSVIWRKGNE